jgi:coproporphyrinogen III oxidase
MLRQNKLGCSPIKKISVLFYTLYWDFLTRRNEDEQKKGEKHPSLFRRSLYFEDRVLYDGHQCVGRVEALDLGLHVGHRGTENI